MKRVPAFFTLLRSAIIITICLSATAFAQNPEMLCESGAGGYTGKSRTGVAVAVEADRSSGLATRSCKGTLKVGGNETVVAKNAAELDLDMLDATLEEGIVVAGFQVRQSDKDCCVTYRLYSLTAKPTLLFTMRGGSSFVAQDADLNDEVEFWTDDAAAVQGFEGITLSEFDYLPTYVLRYYSGGLHDASAEFAGFYDKKIGEIRAALTDDALREFAASDGRLQFTPKSTAAELERLHRLRQTKIKILEIVWAYLYSSREQQALTFLSEHWPATDRDRIWSAIRDARRRGIQTQLPAIAGPPPRTAIFRDPTSITYVADPKNQATAILERVHEPIQGEFSMDLIIDAAGKVRDVHSHKKLPPGILATAMNWKFVPAWREGHSVASFRALTFFLKK